MASSLDRLEQTVKNFIRWDAKESPILKRFFLKLRPNVALRYFPVLAYIKKSGFAKPSVLEVGSGSIGITRFLGLAVTGVDIAFSGPGAANLNRVKCSATSLPFADKTFDIAISLDVIEHMPPGDRSKVLSEMVRVSKKAAIIGFPSGEEAERWEARARKVCDRKIAKCASAEKSRDLIKRSAFLNEHLQNGLPRADDVLSCLQIGLSNHNRAGDIRTIEDESVLVWYALSLASIRTNTLRWLLTTGAASLALPWLRRVKLGGYYRTLCLVEFRDNG